jgi:hypothetical protein
MAPAQPVVEGMEFSFNASAFKEVCWEIGNLFSHRTAQRKVSGTFPVQGRLGVNLPLGSLRIVGADRNDAVIELAINAFTKEQADAVSYSVQQRDGEATLLIDGPFSGAKNLATVSAVLTVPRALILDVQSNMGSVTATDVGSIRVQANMGSVVIDGTSGDCHAHSNMGKVRVRVLPQWRGSSGVYAGTNMGKAAIAIPNGLQFECKATSNMGGAEVSVGSTPGAPPAIAHSNMGSVKIVPA